MKRGVGEEGERGDGVNLIQVKSCVTFPSGWNGMGVWLSCILLLLLHSSSLFISNGFFSCSFPVLC